MPDVTLTNPRQAAAVYEAMTMLRVFMARADRQRLPYSEADVAAVQEAVLVAFPGLRTTYTGSRRRHPDGHQRR